MRELIRKLENLVEDYDASVGAAKERAAVEASLAAVRAQHDKAVKDAAAAKVLLEKERAAHDEEMISAAKRLDAMKAELAAVEAKRKATQAEVDRLVADHDGVLQSLASLRKQLAVA